MPVPTPEELKAFLVKHGLGPQRFADMVPLTRGAVQHYLNGTRPVPKWLGRVMRDIERELQESQR